MCSCRLLSFSLSLPPSISLSLLRSFLSPWAVHLFLLRSLLYPSVYLSPSFCLSLCLSLRLCLSVSLSLSQSIFLLPSIFLSLCLSVSRPLSVCLCLCLCLPLSLSVHFSLLPSISFSPCLSVSLTRPVLVLARSQSTLHSPCYLHGTIRWQRPLTHPIWLRLSIDWNGSEQIRPCPSICLKFWTQEACVVLHISVSKYNMPQKNCWALQCYLAQFDHSSFGRESLLHAQASFMGKFLLHAPCHF